MSNYTTENLTPAIPVPGVPAIRIGEQVFVMQSGGGGGGSTDFYKCAINFCVLRFGAKI